MDLSPETIRTQTLRFQDLYSFVLILSLILTLTGTVGNYPELSGTIQNCRNSRVTDRVAGRVIDRVTGRVIDRALGNQQ